MSIAGWQGRTKLMVLAAGAALAVAGCSLPAPPGKAPLRYRDVIFSNLTTTSGLVYGSAPDLSGKAVTLTLDMYQPTGDTRTGRPAIVLVHGGSFVGGSSTDSGVVKLARNFAERGYVAVSINYRLLGDKEKCGQEDPPSSVCLTAALAGQHDAQAAVRWLRANASTYRIDPSRLGIEGTSAGAAIALAVAVNSGDPGTSGNPGYSSKVGAAASISGALPHSVAATYYDAADSPILMFSGTADQTVPFSVATTTALDLAKAGIAVVFEPLEGAGHVPFSTYGPLMITQSVYFFYDFLDLAHAAGQPPAAGAAFDRQARTYARRYPALAQRLGSQASRR